ncbi:iron ABC transporter permease [Mobiluncus mulieris]|uniref:Iron ABC transporter permease n=1 Tax=Mobiluncus mulieris TaxID=2052 RepID=A0A7Y0Y4T9_9ACTO|nr:iron ABC transporter permease [Mobiluncus mulieris]NMW65731.1 iron ABC transporter permease [Mobiluncus mulieris]
MNDTGVLPVKPKPRRGTAGTRKRYFKYRFHVAMNEPTTLIGLMLVILFAYIILAPVVSLLTDSARVQFGDGVRAGSPVGSITSYYFWRVFRSSVAQAIFWKPLVHTLVISLVTVVFSLFIGGFLAWLLTRTNLWGRKWLSTGLLIPYMLPSWTFALAWLSLFKNRKVGGQPGWLEAMGINPPDYLAYGSVPIIVVLTIHYMPFVLMLFGNALTRFDSQLEDSARILGASPATVAKRVILPLMRPSLVSSLTLVFARCLGDFGVTYILGVPVSYDVLATSLFRASTSRQSGATAVLALCIILLGIASVLIDARMAKQAKRYVTIGSKGSMSRIRPLGRMRAPVSIFVLLVFFLSAISPMLVLFMTTVMRSPGVFTWNNLTWDFWVGHNLTTTVMPNGILLTRDFWISVWNTLWMVGVTSILAGFLGLMVGYVVMRTPVKMVGTFLRHVTFLPYLVPQIVFAAAILSLFAVPRGLVPALYGTPWILLIAMTASEMPFATRSGISSMIQLGKEPEEAAQNAGAGWVTRMMKVLVPIQKGSIVAGVLMPFISGIKGLSLVVLLAVPGTDLMTTYSIRLLDYGYQQAANAVTLMICVVALGGTIVVQKLTKTSIAAGLGS